MPHLTTWLYCAPLRGLWGQGGLMSQGLHHKDSPYYCPPKHLHFRAPLASYINTIYHMEWLIEHLHCVVLTVFFGKYFVLVLLSLVWVSDVSDLSVPSVTPWDGWSKIRNAHSPLPRVGSFIPHKKEYKCYIYIYHVLYDICVCMYNIYVCVFLWMVKLYHAVLIGVYIILNLN